MNILLIRPKPSGATIGLQHIMVCEPLELEYVSAAVERPGVSVSILDMILETRPLESFLPEFEPDLVGLTAYITHVNIVKKYAGIIKSRFPDCICAVGGVHAEVVPTDFEDEHIDHIIQSDSLNTFRRISEAVEQHRKVDVATLPGIWQPGIPIPKKHNHFSASPPDRSKVARYRAKYYYIFHNPCALIKTSFGCPFRCKFCFCKEITSRQYFTRPLDDVMRELKTIPEPEIYIVDDNFLVDKKRVLEFCRLLSEQNIQKHFLIYGRADFIAQNPDVIAEFASKGLRAVIVGLESASSEELEQYDKKTNVNTNERAIAVLRHNDVECYGTFILGCDWKKKDFTALLHWLKKNQMVFVNLQPFTPLPGTELFSSFQDKLTIPRAAYEKWDLAHLVLRPTGLSIRQYYWHIIRVYYGVTLHPRTVLRLIRKYGLLENLKLSVGTSRITFQYIKKWLLGK